MEPTIDDFCKLNFVVYLVFELLSISYHICFSLDLFITLKSPFLAGYKRIKVYHVFAFLFTVIAIAFSFEESESTSSSFRHL